MSARSNSRSRPVNDDSPVSTLAEVARILNGEYRDGAKKFMARCPVHDDGNPSLSVSVGPHGHIIAKCFGGCSQERVTDALIKRGIRISPAKREPSAVPVGKWKLGTAQYHYRDRDGAIAYRKVKDELFTDGGVRLKKTFRQQRPDGKGGWINSLDGLEVRPLYHLPELLERHGEDVHFCEGEKDCETLADFGLLSTTADGVSKTDLTPLGGRRLFIHQDNDPAGQQKTDKLVAALRGMAAEMRVVLYPDAGPKGDVTDWVRKGNRSLAELLEHLESAKTPEEIEIEHQASVLEFDSDIELNTRADDLIEGLMHPGDLVAIWGASGAAKTFAALDMAYHLGHGRPYYGRAARAVPVLYVSYEGNVGFQNRMIACSQKYGRCDRLARAKISAPLDRQGGEEGQKRIIGAAKALSNVAGAPVGVIFIDTVARAMNGDDENSAQDMGAFVGRLNGIQQETGAAVVIVHHPGKDIERGMRGSNALLGACDATIKVERNGSTRSVIAEKVKDGPDNIALFDFTLETVTLGEKDNGKAITSCIVRQIGDTEIVSARTNLKPGTASAKALNELQELIDAGHVHTPTGSRFPTSVKAVKRSEWRDACLKAQISEGAPESQEKAFRRAAMDLENKGLVSRNGDFVWRPIRRTKHSVRTGGVRTSPSDATDTDGQDQ